MLNNFNKYNIYKPEMRLYQYTDTTYKLVYIKYKRELGFESIDNDNKILYKDYSNISESSISRTKRNIKEIALCNDFEYFATFTIDKKTCDRFSLQEVQDTMHKVFKAYKRKYKNFKYLLITEKHKDGAFHFHGLVKGVEDIYTNKNNYLSSYFFNKLGFNSFSKIKDYNKCCNYICKYITKDCVKNLNNQIYFCSKGLKKAEVSILDLQDFQIKNWDFENDFVKILNIDLLKPCDKSNIFNISHAREIF